MNTQLPRWLVTIMTLVLASVALLVFFNYDRMHIYGTYLREKSPEITLRLIDLSSEMNEAQLRKHFEGVSLNCISQSFESNGLGDRVCYASIDKSDGDAALTLAAFFRKDKLSNVIVHVPWWIHQSRIARLTAQFGLPSTTGKVSRFGGPVLRWKLSNGYVETNRDRSFNLFEWNLIMWTSTKG